jgi:SAM-dependent methyltransferase
MATVMVQGAEKSGKYPVQVIRDLGRELGFWRSGAGYEHSCKQLFRDIDFSGKTMLEIGCGKGIYCLWAKVHGAKRVIGLEPLADGCLDSSRCYQDFNSMKNALRLEDIEILPHTVQDYECQPGSIDIMLLYSSINHLDEPQCIELRKRKEARETYLGIFRHLRRMMKSGGKILIVDCSNRNFFGDIGIWNPISPTLEWHKHQSPEFWADLLSQAGFSSPRISWLNGNWSRRHLRWYNVSKTYSYFRDSVFRLEMTC